MEFKDRSLKEFSNLLSHACKIFLTPDIISKFFRDTQGIILVTTFINNLKVTYAIPASF